MPHFLPHRNIFYENILYLCEDFPEFTSYEIVHYNEFENNYEMEKTLLLFFLGWFYKLVLLAFESKTAQAEYNQTYGRFYKLPSDLKKKVSQSVKANL